jgi:hypothetical protein
VLTPRVKTLCSPLRSAKEYRVCSPLHRKGPKYKPTVKRFMSFMS